MKNFFHKLTLFVLLTLIVKTWFVEGLLRPIIVSGSSMAPLLLGAHFELVCPHCDNSFQVGAEQMPASRILTCPVCKQFFQTTKNKISGGDRLLINRFSYGGRSPSRWEVVLFHSPKNKQDRNKQDRNKQDSGKQGYYVKRIIGLPGERIQFKRGDLWVGDALYRKTLAEQRWVRRRVEGATAAKPFSKLATSPAPNVSRILDSNSDSPSGIAGAELSGWRFVFQPDLLTDDSGYNQKSPQTVHLVEDLMLTGKVDLSGSKVARRFGFFLVTPHKNYLVRWKTEVHQGITTETLQLFQKEDLLTTVDITNKVCDLSGRTDFTFSCFDQQILFAVNNQTLLIESVLEVEKNQEKLTEKKLVHTPALLESKEITLGVSASLKKECWSELQVWRDAYYYARRRDGVRAGVGPAAAEQDKLWWNVLPKSYFVLGENLAVSDDSRSWSAGCSLAREKIVGSLLYPSSSYANRRKKRALPPSTSPASLRP